MARRKPARLPALVNVGGALLLLLLVAPLALASSLTPPPAVAEFAPEAIQQIKQAPQEQTATAGHGAGGAGLLPGQPSPTPSLLALTSPSPPVDTGRVKNNCVGDPPRQIADPKSPPCIPYWAGDNHGPTGKGIGPATITVVWVSNGNSGQDAATADLEKFFNRTFQFYNRSLSVVVVPDPSTGTPAAQQALATSVDEQDHAFASLGYPAGTSEGGAGFYYDELARRRVMSFDYYGFYTEPGHAQQKAPYEWGFYPDWGWEQRNESDWICSGLAGGTAKYAGAGSVGLPRVFGIIREIPPGGAGITPDDSLLVSQLRACGAKLGPDVVTDGSPNAASSAILKMKTANPPVTSLLCFCDGGFSMQYPMKEASSEDYFPEWILSDFTHQQNDWTAEHIWPQEQAQHAFGITFDDRHNHDADMPSHWALYSVDPAYSSPGQDLDDLTYSMFLQLASAIQTAGPDLTPSTAQDGLFRTSFPNPGCGAAPYFQACVHYSPGHMSMQGNGTLLWYGVGQPAWPSYAGPAGAFCWWNHGQRFTLGSWPHDDSGFFGANACH